MSFPYRTKIPDKEIDGLFWSVTGNPDDETITVTATKGSLVFSETAKSTIVCPKMRDRIWGIDHEDDMLALRLSAKIFREHEIQLNGDTNDFKQ
jgi:hypothetical protein